MDGGSLMLGVSLDSVVARRRDWALSKVLKKEFSGDRHDATAHHHLIVVHLEAWQRFRVAHFDLVPGDVVDPAGVFIDEVVMTIRVRIEEHRVGSEMQLPKQPLFRRTD